MLQITNDFKNKTAEALALARLNFSGSDKIFSGQWGINPAVYSRLKNGEIDVPIKESTWLEMGRKLNVPLNERVWKLAKTEVYTTIEEDIEFCQTYAKARICVDDSEIGKSTTAKHLSRTRANCFYVDASQAKTKQLFIRLIAKTIGVESDGKYADVKENIKYYLRMLPSPMVIIDEAGDLEYKAFLELKEFWNATEYCCGWYMIGDDSLREAIEKGTRNKKVGFRAIFSRFSSSYTTVTPIGLQDKLAFYKQLIGDVLAVNMDNKELLPSIVAKCLAKDSKTGQIGGLRRAESILLLSA